MTDARHKKSQTKEGQEDVTEEFRLLVRETLARNKARNALAGARKGDPDHLISNKAELAEATGIDPTLLGRIIGSDKPGGKLKPVGRALGLPEIRLALKLPEIRNVPVRASRVATIERLAALPDEEFQALERGVAKHTRTK